MRITVKVGTSTLAYNTGMLNIRHMETLCRVLSDIKNSGHEIILVSSGAVGMGMGKLGLKKRPSDMPTKQAAAAVGQCELMYTYDREFSSHNHVVAQMLLTSADFNNHERHENFINAITRLLDMGVLPIINENDSVVTEEIKIGDNDTLSALVAVSTKSDLLIMLSDVDGFYTDNPRTNKEAVFIPYVNELGPRMLAVAQDAGSPLGTGGMHTKLKAAKLCMDAGFDAVLANGSDPSIIYEILEGEPVGTRFVGKKEKKNDDL